MDDGKKLDEKESPRRRVRWSKLAYLRHTESDVKDELRAQFVRQVQITAPEVLQELRDRVFPEYVKAQNAAKQSLLQPTESYVRFKWPQSLQAVVVKWAEDFRLLDNGKSPAWVLNQVETTLQMWSRNPKLIEERLSWILVGGYSTDGVSAKEDLFLIDLPRFRWLWELGTEDKESAKWRIMKTVGEIVERRLGEMERVLEDLPRLRNKRNRDHFAWTVLNQVRGIKLKDLADRYGVAFTTVKNEVVALKASLGIGLPKGRHPRNSIASAS